MTSRKLLQAVFASALALGSVANGFAQEVWPTKPVKIIVPFPAGGSSDPPMRVLSVKLQEALGQPVITKPDRFAALIKKDLEFWGPVVKASGARVD